MQIRLLDLLCRIKRLQEEREILRRNQALELLKTLKKEYEELIEERKKVSQVFTKSRFFKAVELQDLIRLRDSLLEWEKIAEKKLKDGYEELAKIEEELLERHKERRLFERLKEKEMWKQSEEELKRLYRELDELALLIQGQENKR
jgi:flagellar biosynthesis chaperone FliJ